MNIYKQCHHIFYSYPVNKDILTRFLHLIINTIKKISLRTTLFKSTMIVCYLNYTIKFTL